MNKCLKYLTSVRWLYTHDRMSCLVHALFTSYLLPLLMRRLSPPICFLEAPRLRISDYLTQMAHTRLIHSKMEDTSDLQELSNISSISFSSRSSTPAKKIRQKKIARWQIAAIVCMYIVQVHQIPYPSHPNFINRSHNAYLASPHSSSPLTI